MILAKDEDDVASNTIQPSELLEHAKFLSVDDIYLIKQPVPLSKVEREWMREHDRLGHIYMDKLVRGGMLNKSLLRFVVEK